MVRDSFSLRDHAVLKDGLLRENEGDKKAFRKPFPDLGLGRNIVAFLG